jgi:hypothetical protein
MNRPRLFIASVLVVCFTLMNLSAGSWDQYPESVRNLLEKPWGGPARLTFQNGTHKEGQILRVTDQYVTFTEGNPLLGGGPCTQIELPRLAGAKYLGISETGEDTFVGIVFAPLWIPARIFSWVHPNPIEGLWQSAVSQGDGISVVEFRGDLVDIESASVSEGRYRFDRGMLHLSPSSGTDQTISATMSCGDVLSVGPLRLQSYRSHGAHDHEYAPIVGYWASNYLPPRTAWDLREDGTFRKEVITAPVTMKFKRSYDRIKLDSGEEWTFHRNEARLSIIKAGVTTEYTARAFR